MSHSSLFRVTPLILLSMAAILSGCATAPKGGAGSLIASDVRLEVERDRPQSSRQQRIDRAAIAQAKTLHVAPPRFADGADTALSPREREVILAGVGRALCTRTSKFFEVVAAEQPADIVLRSEVTGVGLTNRGVAGASLVVGALSPIPFTPRLPAGMGGLSADVVASAADGARVLEFRWAQGANAFTTDATPSRLGDAYALTDVLARDVRRLLRDEGDGRRRERVDAPVRRRSKEACLASFGRIEAGKRLARLALPLTPEFVEAKAGGGDSGR
jgi:hypothetical protein